MTDLFRRTSWALSAGFAFLAVSPTIVASAPKAPGRAELVKALSACRALTDPTERLACFDKTAAALDEAQTKGDVVIVDRHEVQEVKRQAFGFSLDALSVFDKGGKAAPEDTSINAVAKAAVQNATGKWIITLEGGAVWRQIDTDTLNIDPHPGSKVHIRRASLGSFLMSIDGQNSIRVHRDE
jgi:hypothetical protein